jgi:hypothetical protein
MWQAGCYSNAEHAVVSIVSKNGNTFPVRFDVALGKIFAASGTSILRTEASGPTRSWSTS